MYQPLTYACVYCRGAPALTNSSRPRTSVSSSKRFLQLRQGSCARSACNCMCMYVDPCVCIYIIILHTCIHIHIHKQMLPDYFKHMSAHKDTLLCCFFALFRIHPKKRYFVIMHNVMHTAKEIHEVCCTCVCVCHAQCKGNT